MGAKQGARRVDCKGEGGNLVKRSLVRCECVAARRHSAQTDLHCPRQPPCARSLLVGDRGARGRGRRWDGACAAVAAALGRALRVLVAQEQFADTRADLWGDLVHAHVERCHLPVLLQCVAQHHPACRGAWWATLQGARGRRFWSVGATATARKQRMPGRVQRGAQHV